MKGKRKFFLGCIIGFILGSLTIAGANQAIEAIQNTEIKINMNGQVQEFKDASTGEIQYPLTYNGRTYLPLRNVADLSGLNVEYDNDTNTAFLNEKERSIDSIIKDICDYYKRTGEFTSLSRVVTDDGILYTLSKTENMGEFYIYNENGQLLGFVQKTEDGYKIQEINQSTSSTTSSSQTTRSMISPTTSTNSSDVSSVQSSASSSIPSSRSVSSSVSTPTSSYVSSGRTVYITDSGKKYHGAGCRYLKSSTPIGINDAISMGYTACGVCNP